MTLHRVQGIFILDLHLKELKPSEGEADDF